MTSSKQPIPLDDSHLDASNSEPLPDEYFEDDYTFKEEIPVTYPPLKGNKIQPPEYGCLMGYYGMLSPKFDKELKNIRSYGSEDVVKYLDSFKERFGRIPCIFETCSIGLDIWDEFPIRQVYHDHHKESLK